MLKDQLEAIREAALKDVASAGEAASGAMAQLDAVRVRYLGKKGELTAI